jgi:hypothetical protein
MKRDGIESGKPTFSPSTVETVDVVSETKRDLELGPEPKEEPMVEVEVEVEVKKRCPSADDSEREKGAVNEETNDTTITRV